MIKRIIDISRPSYLSVKHKQLLIRQENRIVGTVPVEDLGALLLQHPAIVITQQCIIQCQKHNAVIIFCDEKHLPYAALYPLSEGHSLHSKILQMQIALTLPTRKRLWQQIVQEKIRQQIANLKDQHLSFTALHRLEQRVKSGDRDNCEAQAASKYWPLLFGKAFRRRQEENGINTLLNYGYALIRAAVARAIVSGGLHPAMGIHHHNQYNGLNLADDLMEPFRPWVDRAVYQYCQSNDNPEINQQSKRVLLALLHAPVLWKKKQLPFWVATHHLVAELKRVMVGKKKRLAYPLLR